MWSLVYRALTDDSGINELIWYSIRIILLVGVILLFMMMTLKRFLTREIINPLGAIASANRSLNENDPNGSHVHLPENAPSEIKEIESTRREMLGTILKVSEERLNLANFIRKTFGRYLSQEVVKEILESPKGQKIGGRKEIVTILMSDLRGFTSLSETSDPEELVQLLNRYLERMSKVIMEYGGMIDEFIGDAILAVFGVPEKHTDDPARAVACGLAMQNALKALNEEIADEGYPTLEMGIGINTGMVIVGNMGSELRTKYGIVGPAVNRAARIESNTTGEQVLIGESTYEHVKGLIKYETPQNAMMKGVKKPLISYPVTEIGAPFNIKIESDRGNDNGIEIILPFHCWKVEDKKVSSESMLGETITMNENIITATVNSPLEPLTNIKLIFDFCAEAHCFEDIYAKVLSVEKNRDSTINNLRITAINQKDREILKKWIREGS